MAFPMRALVEEVRERSRAAPRRAASPPGVKPPLIYWRPIAAAALFTVSFMVTMVVASRRSEAAPGPGAEPARETLLTWAHPAVSESAIEPARPVTPRAEAPRHAEPAAPIPAYGARLVVTSPPSTFATDATATPVVVPSAPLALSAAPARVEMPVIPIPADPFVLERMEDLVTRRPLAGVEPAEPIEPVKLPGVNRTAPAVLAEPTPPECERYGTTIDFVRNPKEAARIAKAEDKLTFLLHVSGNFEDDAFT
jgi:hypothetical protein